MGGQPLIVCLLVYRFAVFAIYAVRPNSNTGNTAEPTTLSSTVTTHVVLSARRTCNAVLSRESTSDIVASLGAIPEGVRLIFTVLPSVAVATCKPALDESFAIVYAVVVPFRGNTIRSV